MNENSQAIRTEEIIIKGKIEEVGQTKDVSATMQARDLILAKDDERYTQFITIQFVQANVNKLDSFKPGERVSVSINLRGRKWVNPQGETKYFNSIEGWKISHSN